MADVVVVGSLMIDLVSVTERLPKPGETIHGQSFVQNFGGKGANQCVSAHRLGASTAMVGSLGDDNFGDEYKKEFQKSGTVNTEFLRQHSNSRSGIASIWVDSKGQNSIIITANANNKSTVESVREAENLIQKAKLIVCQLEIPSDATLEALKLAKKHKVRSIFNPAPATPNLDNAYFQYIDIICPNETEAELLCGYPVDSEENCQKALEWFLKKGVNIAIITLGEKGAVFATKENSKATNVRTDKVKVVDSTGAGDAFVGALAYFLVKNPEDDLQFTIWKACRFASLSVQKSGTQPSFPYLKDIDAFYFDRNAFQKQ